MLNRLRDFTYDAYIDFINLLKKKYRIIPFCEVTDTNAPFLILRHDVDASLEAALKMAEREKKLEIKSTYFVLFSHKLYNLLEKDSLNTLKEISGLGHEIGLHYDVETYESYGRTPRESMHNEIQMLERLLNRKIFSVACHNVSLITGEDPLRNVKGYINVYDPRFCENYVSDSCRAWFLRDLSRLLEFKSTRVHLLIHPFLWTENACKRETVLANLFNEVAARNRIYKEEWLRVWHENAKVKAYDKSVRKLKRDED
ncbi:MAG: hypothetical protein ABSG57_05775 [Candidatus Bathyarchaeia archaeon]